MSRPQSTFLTQNQDMAGKSSTKQQCHTPVESQRSTESRSNTPVGSQRSTESRSNTPVGSKRSTESRSNTPVGSKRSTESRANTPVGSKRSTESRANTPVRSKRDLSDVDSDQMDFSFDAAVTTKKSRLTSSSKTRANRLRSQRVPNYVFSDQMSVTSDEDFDVLSDDQINYPHFIPAEENSDSTDSETHCTTSPKSKPDPVKQKKSMCTLTIKTCTKTKDGKRLYDKKHFCIYCMKPNSKISRHLERKHGTEEDVARACSFPKGSKKRSALLEELRNKGDYQHNILVLEEGKGEIVTWRQPPASASIEDYLPCSHCLGFFVKSELWRHESSCRAKKDEEKGSKNSEEKGPRKRVQSLASHLIPISKSASQGCQKIIHKMQQDSVAFHIRNDPFICQFGDALYAERGHELSQHGYISQRLREVGRLMVAVKKLDSSIKYLQDICKPSQFELVVEAAKKVSGFNPDRNDYTKPSSVIRIGHSLTKAAECLANESVMIGNKETQKDATNFVKLMTSCWRTQVTSKEQKKWNKDAAPLTEVVEILTSS